MDSSGEVVFISQGRIAGAVAVAALSALLVPAVAGAADAPSYNPIMGEGNVGIADVSFHAANTAPTGTAATGFFKGENQAMKLTGPINCLQVEGKRAGFIYTADSNSQPAPFQGKNIMITIEDYSPGGTGKFGFTILQSGADLTKCAPQDTPITASSGHFSVERGVAKSERERNADVSTGSPNN